MTSVTRSILLPGLLLILTGCATTHTERQPAPQPIDASKGTPSPDGSVVWFNAIDIGVEGQGWKDGLAHPYDRLPASAEGVVPDAVWDLSRRSAGLSVRFVTDSPTVAARWTLRFNTLAMNHMPATGVSGVDLYVRHENEWGWIGVGIPEKVEGNESTLVTGAPPGPHEYLLYLPLYNGVESVEIGIKPGSILQRGPAYDGRLANPMLFWGSSILQGGCASRPGLAYPSIIGRRMQRPVINLGFSGNGRMDPPLVDLIATLDVSVYVIDCAPNMDPALISERTEPLVRTLRKARPDTPIVLIENVPYEKGWFLNASRKAYVNKNAALKAAYDRLRRQGVKRLYYIPCDELFGDDHEATVDGVHPNDAGFIRMADAVGPHLRRILR
jgi:hypothetical protein